MLAGPGARTSTAASPCAGRAAKIIAAAHYSATCVGAEAARGRQSQVPTHRHSVPACWSCSAPRRTALAGFVVPPACLPACLPPHAPRLVFISADRPPPPQPAHQAGGREEDTSSEHQEEVAIEQAAGRAGDRHEVRRGAAQVDEQQELSDPEDAEQVRPGPERRSAAVREQREEERESEGQVMARGEGARRASNVAHTVWAGECCNNSDLFVPREHTRRPHSARFSSRPL